MKQLLLCISTLSFGVEHAMVSSAATQLPAIEACQWREAFKQKIARVPHKVFKRVPHCVLHVPCRSIYIRPEGFTSEIFTHAMAVYKKRAHSALEKIVSIYIAEGTFYCNPLIRMLVEIAHVMHDESFELLIVDAYNKILPQIRPGRHSNISFCALHNIKHMDVTHIERDQDKLNGCLEIALACHSLHCLPKLITDPAQLDKKIFHKFEYPLHQASSHSLKAVKLLLEASPALDVNALDNYGHTPLLRAALFNHKDICNFFLAREDVDDATKAKAIHLLEAKNALFVKKQTSCSVM